MNKDEIAKAISMSYQEGLMRAYDNRELAAFMFIRNRPRKPLSLQLRG